MVIAVAGVSSAFIVNVISFCGVIVVVARWKRPIRKQSAPPETLTGATVAAVRYVRNSPAKLTVLIRTGIVLFFSSSLFALLPSVARSVDERAIGYGLLLGCFGAGAIGGALLMQTLRARFSTETIVSAGVVILGAAIVAIARLNQLSTLALVVLFSGAAWVLFISLIDALVHPRSRLGASASVGGFHACLHGKFCLGKCSLGGVAQHRSVRLALFWGWDNWEGHACPVRQASGFPCRSQSLESLAYAAHRQRG
jgi:predicted MFS family arabinose efflux permease